MVKYGPITKKQHDKQVARRARRAAGKPAKALPRAPAAVSRPRAVASVGALRKFTCALSDPFCKEAQGAKVPDMFSFPTEVATVRGRFTWSPGATSRLLVLPHPVLSAIDVGSGGVTGSMIALSGIATTWQVNSVATNLNSIPIYNPVQPATFASSYGAYRIVGWGIRFRNISAATAVSGDAIVSLVPATGYLAPEFLNPLAGTLVANPSTAWSGLMETFGLPAAGFDATNATYGSPIIGAVDSLPVTESYSAAEIAQSGGVQINPMFHSPSAWSFKPTAISGNGPDVFLTATSQGGPTTGPAYFNKSGLDISGNNAVLIAASTGQTWEVEVVYHLEVTSRGAQAGFASQAVSSPVAPPNKFLAASFAALASPWVRFAQHEGQRMYGNAIQALPGLLTKAALAAMA